MTERENLETVGVMMANSNEVEIEQLNVKLYRKRQQFMQELNTA